MEQYLLALDAGTGSVRAVIFSVEGEQVGVAQREWTHLEDPRWPGSMDFDWTTNWGLARTCIQEVLAKTGIAPTQIAGISTTCMREGILLYDADGNEIWACANVDARSDDEVGQLIAMDPELEREIYLESFTSRAARPTRSAPCPGSSGSRTRCPRSTRRRPRWACSTTGSSTSSRASLLWSPPTARPPASWT